MFRDLASKYYGIFKVAGVDCLEEEELCEVEFFTFDYPTVMIFPSNIRMEGLKYTGNMEVGHIAKFAVQ